jgi:hypothetical protein
MTDKNSYLWRLDLNIPMYRLDDARVVFLVVLLLVLLATIKISLSIRRECLQRVAVFVLARLV